MLVAKFIAAAAREDSASRYTGRICGPPIQSNAAIDRAERYAWSPRESVRAVALLAFLVLIPVLSLLPGCSVYMEATRPTPVDLSKFEPGQTRDAVVEQLGTPKGTTREADGASCDSYALYTKGYGAGGKVPVAFVEGAADVFTLGLAEVISTPVEAATKNDLHPVTICYSDEKLVRVIDTGVIVSSGSAPASGAQASANGPSPSVTRPPKPSTPNVAISAASSAPLNPDLTGSQPAVPQTKPE
jgi:hypothetical protein